MFVALETQYNHAVNPHFCTVCLKPTYTCLQTRCTHTSTHWRVLGWFTQYADQMTCDHSSIASVSSSLQGVRLLHKDEEQKPTVGWQSHPLTRTCEVSMLCHSNLMLSCFFSVGPDRKLLCSEIWRLNESGRGWGRLPWILHPSKSTGGLSLVVILSNIWFSLYFADSARQSNWLAILDLNTQFTYTSDIRVEKKDLFFFRSTDPLLWFDYCG